MKQRLQKILAHAGVASRRKVEEMIAEGLVTVNGRVAVIGEKADPAIDHIKVGQKKISGSEPKVYVVMNKPRGVITSLSDPEGRKTVMDFLKGVRVRIFPVGRLDYHSEGLLILTNDGELANRLMHPSSKVDKVYHVKIREKLSDSEISRLRRGIRLDDGITAPAIVKPLPASDRGSWVEITIHEGRQRQVRRMFEAVGHLVQRLRRVRIGPLALGGLKAGESRLMSQDELTKLSRSIGPARKKSKVSRQKLEKGKKR